MFEEGDNAEVKSSWPQDDESSTLQGFTSRCVIIPKPHDFKSWFIPGSSNYLQIEHNYMKMLLLIENAFLIIKIYF